MVYGRNRDGSKFVQRFAFSSQFSDPIKTFIHDPRFAPIQTLIGEGVSAHAPLAGILS